MTATERDREVAAEIVRRGGYRVVDAIAAALASERARALAPVLALAKEWESLGSRYTLTAGLAAEELCQAAQDPPC